MSHIPRVTPSPAIITHTKREGIDITINDGNYTLYTHINRFGELNKAQDNTFAIKLKRNLNGQIIKKSETLQGKAKVGYTYRYDKQGRLIEVKRNNQSVERYSYDGNGNRKHAYVYGKHYQANYTLDDQLIVYGQNSYRYNDDGYLIKKTTPEGTTAYSYNTMGALTDVTLPNGTQIHYITDPLNRRIAKEVNGTIVEKYLWEDLTTLLAVYDKDDNLVWRFEYADGRMPISMTDKDGNRYYLHYDQVGSLRAVSDANGKIVKEIAYDSYGNVLSDSAPSFKVPFGFAGGLYDSNTKLTHFGFREYDAFTGKWTSKDPLLFGGGDSNLYGYVLGDPVDLVDPEGLEWYKPWTWLDDYNKAKKLANESLQNARNSSLGGKHNGMADAYRHCLWSCKLAYNLGSVEAWLFGTGHEVFQNKLSPYNESQMDLANNCTGRELGTNGSPFTCEIKCMNAVINGSLVTAPPQGGGYGY